MPYHLIEDANMCFDFWKLLSINKATTATTKEEEESISAQNYTLRVQERISIIRIILSPSAGRHAALLPVHKKGYGRLQPLYTSYTIAYCRNYVTCSFVQLWKA